MFDESSDLLRVPLRAGRMLVLFGVAHWLVVIGVMMSGEWNFLIYVALIFSAPALPYILLGCALQQRRLSSLIIAVTILSLESALLLVGTLGLTIAFFGQDNDSSSPMLIAFCVCAVFAVLWAMLIRSFAALRFDRDQRRAGFAPIMDVQSPEQPADDFTVLPVLTDRNDEGGEDAMTTPA